MTKKILCLSLMCVILLFFQGCKTKYKFAKSTDEITKIEIVEILDENIVVLKEVNDIQTFLGDFSNVECFSYFNDPVTEIQGKSIKIYYSNEDIEIITIYAQQRYIKGKYLNGFSYFDINGFENLINKYIE